MNALIPVRAPQPFDMLDEVSCDLCCAVPVAEVIDGDRMCQDCADKWVRNERPDSDLLPLDHPSMRAAVDSYFAVVNRGHRAFERSYRK